MPVSINGNTPAIPPKYPEPLYPHPSGEPQSITFSLDSIRQLEGLYCLNDLHRLSGGEKKNTPSRFIHLDKTQALITALQDIETQKTTQDPKKGSEHFSNMRTDNRNPKKGCEQVFRVVNGGEFHGIYGNRKIVYAYANWIDPYFYAMVLEVFDRVATGQTNYTAKLNALCRDLMDITELLAFCGRNLNVQGKQTKPAIQKEISDIMATIQPQLPFTGE